MYVDARPCLASPKLGVMTFLNEAVQRFPDAISFAPGRPNEQFFDVPSALRGVDRWIEYRVRSTGRSHAQVLNTLGQYGDTAGLIRELVARHLAVDQGIHVAPESILITSGCQEAMAIAVLGLMDPTIDTLLSSDPSYIGITGVAELLGVPVHPVPSGPEGVPTERVEEAIEAVLRSGRRPRALYDVPDFNNPLGTCMPLHARRRLLALADRYEMLVIEDNPYGAYAYDQPPLPTLKALDVDRAVIYLGSFSKTLFPGLRIGYLIADQVGGDTRSSLCDALTTVKSLTTLNTPPLMQAMLGAKLLAHDGSLAPIVEAKLPYYRRNRDSILRALEKHLAADKLHGYQVTWNEPHGGFFVVVDLPFAFGATELRRCAQEYGVVVCPLSFFSLTPGRERSVRLSFSYVDDRAIEEGVRRLSCFVRQEIARLDHKADDAISAGPLTKHVEGTRSLERSEVYGTP